MERVENIELSQPQIVAQKIRSVNYKGYKCLNCSDDRIKGKRYLIIAYESKLSQYRNCPQCQQLTVTRTNKKTLKKATRFNPGKRLVIDKCHYCDYLKQKEETICHLPSPSSGSYSSGGGGFGSVSSSGGGGFGGGSSGGGGGFGGC